MTDRRTALVAAGYDAMADTWETWSAQVTGDPRFDWLTRLTDRLPAGAQVVELGCGNGTTETRELAAGFCLTHVPRELLPQVFDHVLTWLRPGGLFLATLGANDLEEWEGEWLGVPMYFSGHDPPRDRRLLAAFELVDDEVVTISEPEGPVSFHWILARR